MKIGNIYIYNVINLIHSPTQGAFLILIVCLSWALGRISLLGGGASGVGRGIGTRGAENVSKSSEFFPKFLNHYHFFIVFVRFSKEPKNPKC